MKNIRYVQRFVSGEGKRANGQHRCSQRPEDLRGLVHAPSPYQLTSYQEHSFAEKSIIPRTIQAAPVCFIYVGALMQGSVRRGLHATWISGSRRFVDSLLERTSVNRFLRKALFPDIIVLLWVAAFGESSSSALVKRIPQPVHNVFHRYSFEYRFRGDKPGALRLCMCMFTGSRIIPKRGISRPLNVRPYCTRQSICFLLIDLCIYVYRMWIVCIVATVDHPTFFFSRLGLFSCLPYCDFEFH